MKTVSVPVSFQTSSLQNLWITDKAGASGNPNAFALPGGDFGLKPRRHTHVLALMNDDGSLVRPVEVAQIPCQCGSGSASGRVFINTAERKRIAGMEHPRRFGMDQIDGDEPFAHGQRVALLKVILHVPQRLAVFQRQHQMIAAAMRDGWRNTSIEISRAEAEKRECFGKHGGSDRPAAGRRRLERRAPLRVR